MTRPSLSLSSRPAQKSRSFAHSRGSRSKIVRSACGSLLLQTTPRGLCMTRASLGWACALRALPRTVTLSVPGSTFWPSTAFPPFT